MKLIKISAPLDPSAYSYENNPARLNQHMDEAYTPSIGGIKYKIPQKQDKNLLKQNYEGVHLTDDKEKAGLYAMQKSSSNDPPIIITLTRNKRRSERSDVDSIASNRIILDWINDNRNVLTDLIDKEEILSYLEENDDSMFSESNPDGGTWDHKINPDTNPIRAIINNFETLSDINFKRQWGMLMNNVVPQPLAIAFCGQFRELKPIFDDRVVAIEQFQLVNLEPNDDAYFVLQGGDKEEIGEMLDDNEYTLNSDSLFDHEGKKILDREDVEYGNWLEKTKDLYLSKEKVNGNKVYHGTSLNRAKQAYPNLIK